MARTILDLFKGSPQDTSVKADTETFIEQETTGIRVNSLVELSNPLIYGNESIRIVNRTTSTIEDMKSQTGGEVGDGGLIGQGLSKLTGGKVSSISQARDAFNSKLGIPSNPIPSRLIGDIVGLASSEPITKDNIGEGLQGTGLGNFLKDTGGGNPKTIGRQALGKGIGVLKDKLRGALFGEGPSIGEVIGDKIDTEYSNENTYSSTLKDTSKPGARDYKNEGGGVNLTGNPIPFGNQSIDKIDLRKVSPIYGLDRKDNNNWFGNQPGSADGKSGDKYGYQYLGSDFRKNEVLPIYNPNSTYTTALTDTSIEGGRFYKTEGGDAEEFTAIDLSLVSPVRGIGRGRYGNTEYAYAFNPDNPKKNERLPKNWPDNPFADGKIPLESNYGIGKGGADKNIDNVSPSLDYTLDEDNAFIKVGETVYRDFIPVWFRKRGNEKPIVFRAILSGVTETTSPSWSSNKFVGNPYSFYMFDGVERSVSFNIKLFATRADALNTIWERLKILTSYSYPAISSNLANPPIIEFRLGSIYIGKVGFIESLTYTIPDDSNWETDGDLGYLPKTIDVSITVKFIEQNGSEDRLYDFTISKAAADAINQKREANSVSGEPQTGEGEEQTPPKMTTKGESKLEVRVKKSSTIVPNVSTEGIQLPSSVSNFVKDNPLEAQSGVSDLFDGKTPTEFAKESEQKQGITPQQSFALNQLRLTGGNPEIIQRNSLPEFIKGIIGNSNDNLNSIIVYQKGFSKIRNRSYEIWTEIDSNGNTNKLGSKSDSSNQKLTNRE